MFKKKTSGFTLIELLVVISILGVLASIALVAFASAQLRGRDAQRKSDLKQLTNALELFYADYGMYPNASNGIPSGCPYTPPNSWVPCSWGAGELTDSKTTYFKVLPKDPVKSNSYFYRVVAVGGSANQGFQIFAHLENSQDIGCLPDMSGVTSCITPALPGGTNCGTSICNFAVTSPNTKPTD